MFDTLEQQSQRLEQGVRFHLERPGLDPCPQRVGSMWTLFFQSDPVRDWPSASKSDTARFGRFFQALLARGVYLAPSQYEACFTSAAHDDDAVDATVEAIGGALAEVCA